LAIFPVYKVDHLINEIDITFAGEISGRSKKALHQCLYLISAKANLALYLIYVSDRGHSPLHLQHVHGHALTLLQWHHVLLKFQHQILSPYQPTGDYHQR
jgi:hypothetical protein